MNVDNDIYGLKNSTGYTKAIMNWNQTMLEKEHWYNIARQAGLTDALTEIFVTRMLAENLDKSTEEIRGQYEARTVDRYLSDIYGHFRGLDYELPGNGKKLWKHLRELLLAKYPLMHPWESLWSKAQDSDRLMPQLATTTMDLGRVEESFAVGDKITIKLEVQKFRHLILLEKGATGTLYCLAPSFDVDKTSLRAGVVVLPSGKRKAYGLTKPGTEQMVGVLSAEPLAVEWLPSLEAPPLVINAKHIQELEQALQGRQYELLRREFTVTQR